MAFRYKLVHHPRAAQDYREAVANFEEVDAALAEAFRRDFKAGLRGLATGRAVSALYAAGHPIRWIKLRRFSHKIFFEPEGDDVSVTRAAS